MRFRVRSRAAIRQPQTDEHTGAEADGEAVAQDEIRSDAGVGPDGVERPDGGARPEGVDRSDGVDRPDGGASTPPEVPLRSAAARPPPVVVPRWVQLVLLPIALLGLWALASAAGTVLLILIVASIVALILARPVRLLSTRMPRGLAIFLVYIGCFAVVAVIGYLLVNPITSQVSHFERNFPSIVDSANRELASVQTWLNEHGINIHIQRQGQTALQTLQKDVLKRSSDIVAFSRDFFSGLVTIGFDLVLVLVLSVYLLIYGRDIGNLARRVMPDGDGTPEDDYPLLVQRAVSDYVRGQVLFSLIMGASAAAALTLFGVLGIFPDGENYAIFFGAFYGLMEFIPYIGPIIGPVPAVLVALFHSPLTALWVVLLFVALQQLEGHLVAPQVFRISLRINPILIILALLVGYQLYGVAGALVSLPLLAVIRQTVLYLRRHMVLEPWATSGGPGAGLMTPVSPRRCPECGAQAQAGDTVCCECGYPLEPGVPTSS